MSSAIFIDLSNFFSRFVRCGLAEPRELRDYFLNWLDLDLLGEWLTGEERVPIWVFYSGSKLGSKTERVTGEQLRTYVKRISRLTGVTPYDVQIPGDQREPFAVQCDCGKEITGQLESEKGIDSSLIVHLFDTADSWQEAFLLSGDADFIPAVRVLRRKGKLVSGAGFPNAAEGLVREFYSFTDLSVDLIREDFAAYLLFGPQGIVEKWLSDPVQSSWVMKNKDQATLHCKWLEPTEQAATQNSYSGGRRLLVRSTVQVMLGDEALAENIHRAAITNRFQQLFPEYCTGSLQFSVSNLAWQRVKRVLPGLLSKFVGTSNRVAGQLSATFCRSEDGDFERG